VRGRRAEEGEVRVREVGGQEGGVVGNGRRASVRRRGLAGR
jgi:hypothetical protein